MAEAIEVAVAEMRREHPRWGRGGSGPEMLRKPGPWSTEGIVVPAERTIDRIVHRQRLLQARPGKRPRDSYIRFERPGPMQLRGMDIVGRIWLVKTTTGELREGKVVTAVDDHSRFCVIASAMAPPEWSGGPVEFDRVVPPSGNMIVCQRQFWMGTHRAGRTARVWADCELIRVREHPDDSG